ncbi:MAG: ArsR family transcriptional regulator [Asgard group archaeon]|nr:ArsR family transcriptional regulator [Asgard group archaeon]
MSNKDDIFLALKSETRRKILAMLAAEPMYLTQLAEQLDIHQQAIFRHLEQLMKAGLLDSDYSDEGQGAPRKYYRIARAIRVEVQISPEMFDVELFDVLKIEIPTPEEYPELAKIVDKCSTLSKEPISRDTLMIYSNLLKELGFELQKVNTAKAIAEATYSNIRRQIRKISYELLPQRIDRRLIQTLASRGGEIKLTDLSLILHLTEEVIKERLDILEQNNLIRFTKGVIYLL